MEDPEIMQEPKLLLDTMCHNSVNKLKDLGIDVVIVDNLSNKG